MMKSLLVLLLVACTSSAHGVRYANRPAVTAVADRADTPTQPAPRPFAHALYHFRGFFVRRFERGLALRRVQPSLGVNALDEVPDSTWFTNRIGVRDLSLDEVRTGPNAVGTPEAHFPWTIKGTKVGGASIGFIVTDARGEKFVLKFDEPAMPEVETAADVIVGHILWAIGYNVPEDHIVYFRASDLVLPADAKVKDFYGNTRPLRRPELERLLAKVSIGADGRIRGLASRMLDGVWLGGHPDEGVRADDPNDRIPHERRRELRGARAIFAWVDHVDVKEDNSLDMWAKDPADPSRHHVMHYWIDFGKSLGTMSASAQDVRRSYSYQLDVANIGRSFVTLGLAERPWERRSVPRLRGVGMFESATFSPADWKPNTPSYLPFHDTGPVDGFWGAKLALRFTRAQLRAIVEQARLTDPRAIDYLTDTLVERQRITARYWFGQVAPLDRFAIGDGGALCFDDLTLTHGLEQAAAITTYSVATRDRAGRNIAAGKVTAATTGRTCTAPLALARDGDGYTIVELRTRRHTLDAVTHIHLARRGGATHVIGIWRTPAGAP
jgi:hypothetical protein